jgi:hypothetical protein
MRKRHGIRQIKLSLRIALVDRLENGERLASSQSHEPGIAKGQHPFGFICILFLANAGEFALFDDEPAITRRIFGFETEDRDRRFFFGEDSPQPQESLGLDKRRICEGHENIVIAFFDRLARRKHGMRGSKTLRLHKNIGCGNSLLDLSRNVIALWADDDRDFLGFGRLQTAEHMRQHRPAAQTVQHLRPRRFHPRALARRKYDGKAAAPSCLSRCHIIFTLRGIGAGKCGIASRSFTRSRKNPPRNWTYMGYKIDRFPWSGSHA